MNDMKEQDRIVKRRIIDKESNLYVTNRDNPDWPLAIKNVKSNKLPEHLVSNRQRRGIRYGQ
jgi:hypothetical protein